MIKTMSFAAVHFSVAFFVGFLMTGSVVVGGAIALVEPVVNTLAYYIHERLWSSAQQKSAPPEPCAERLAA